MGRRFSPGTDSVRRVDAAGAPDAGFGSVRARSPSPLPRVGAACTRRVPRLAAAAPGLANAQAAFVDDAGRRVPIGASVRRVFPAGPGVGLPVLPGPRSAARLDAARCAPTRPRSCCPRSLPLPELGRLTGRGSTVALESVLAMRAELIVDVGAVAPTYSSLADQVQRQTGVPYLLLDGAFERTESTLRRLGSALGLTARAESLARGTRAILDAAAELRAGLAEGDRPRVLLARGPTGLVTSAGLNAEVLDQVGAINVARVDAPNLALVSLEQVSAWRPDWILASDLSFVAQLDRHPVWSRLPAVRARRVLLIPRVPFGWFDAPPALNRLIGIEWLSAVFIRGACDDRLDERLAATFEWLYHRRPSIGQMRALLATTR
ncbi:MAG: ABC transporter substrate-binding protein [Burkholderiaceae bacterium]